MSDGNGAKRDRNGRRWLLRWLLGTLVVVVLGGLGFSVHLALGASAEAQVARKETAVLQEAHKIALSASEDAKAARQETAVLKEAISGVRREVELLRTDVSEAEDLAREERAKITAAIERLQGWR